MWYPAGEDPYKTHEINRQDRFFHDLNQVQEQIIRDQARISESWTRDIQAIPDRAPAYQPAGGSPAPTGPSRRQVRTAVRRQPSRAERWQAALKLLALCIVVDWLLIAGGAAPAWKVIAFTVLAVGSLLAAALALAALARAVGTFLRSRMGKLSLLSGGALAILYLVYGV
ncbi:hypothetical protein B6S44_01765 [Bosea sp. Tri-44]|uniref:hypothetical protein n=1 Tax=Bosea sp. Tri-44 TaxID=1972137 RepID=UPI00100F5058|nr:hypothetical protein [Bosea sp. Tri-44]RXT57189.1 hypothetical protein B6S44_01765 [Bosea sp. Tri-44]